MWLQFLSLIVIGLSVGWLAGLSVSPVAGTIISGLLGLVGGLGAGAMLLGSHRLLDQIRGKPGVDAKEIDMRPAAVLALAVAVGVPSGILARTHQIFAADANGSPGGQVAGPTSGVLFSDRLGDCEELIAASRSDDRYFRELVREGSELGARLERELPLDSLKITVRALCTDS